MASKDSDSSSKQRSFHNALSTNQNGQYSSLNLNQNFKCDNFKLSKSASKSSNDGRKDYGNDKGFVDSKNFVSTFSKRSSSIELKKKDISKNIKTLSLDNSQDEEKWNWKSKKEAKNSAVNSSTLSLHIAAYENSVEAAAEASDIDNELDNFKAKNSLKSTSMNVKLSAAAAPISTFQDQFEFPRQQNQNNSDPLVMQFKATQQLLALGQNDQRGNERTHKLHQLLEKVEPLSELIERNEIDLNEFKKRLNSHHIQLDYQPTKVYAAWRQYVTNVENRFNKNNQRFSTPEDEKIAKIQRKFDPTFCVQMPSTQDRENGQESTSEIHQNGRAQQQQPEEGASMQRGVANVIQNELRGLDVREATTVRTRGRTSGYSPSPKRVKKRSRPAAISQPNNGTGKSKPVKEILKRSRTPATISQRQQRHRTPFQEQPRERQIDNRVSARQQQLNQQRFAFVDQDIPDVSISSQSVANLNQTDQIVEPQQQQLRPVITVEEQQPQAAALTDQTHQQSAPNAEGEPPLENVAPPVNPLAPALQIPAYAPQQQLDQQRSASVQLDTQNGLIQQQQPAAAANSNETDQHRVFAEPPPQQQQPPPFINVEQQQPQAAALAAQTLQQPASNAEVQPPLQNNQMPAAFQIPAVAAALGIQQPPEFYQLMGQFTGQFSATINNYVSEFTNTINFALGNTNGKN